VPLTPELTGLSLREQHDLDVLIHDWGSAYVIGAWTAVRRDSAEDDALVLEGRCAGDLRDKIRADYFARPVPRASFEDQP
jgi:hypothetical protein